MGRDHIVAFDSELPVVVKEGDLRRWTLAFASLVSPLQPSEVRDGFVAVLRQMETHMPFDFDKDEDDDSKEMIAELVRRGVLVVSGVDGNVVNYRMTLKRRVIL